MDESDLTLALIFGLLAYPVLKAIDPSLTRGIEERLPARCWSCDAPVNPEVGHKCPIDPRINWHGCKGKKTAPDMEFFLSGKTPEQREQYIRTHEEGMKNGARAFRGRNVNQVHK